MARNSVHLLVWALLGTTLSAHAAQDVPPHDRQGDRADASSASDTAALDAGPPGTPSGPAPPGTVRPSLLDWLAASLSQEEDVDGPISTDRPTFTPANTVVPPKRLQFESGFTYNAQRTGASRTYLYDFPELAMRYGLMSRLEFRTFWQGQTDVQSQPRAGLTWNGRGGGPSDMEVGFKWQLIVGDKEKRWLPTTALITSIMAPTGGSSFLSAQTVEPYINLIYGWNLTEKLVLCGSTGYLGMREQFVTPSNGRGFDTFQRYHQSLVFFYSAAERTTLFYEWYILMFTNTTDNRPDNFMDGGVLYRLTTNMQLDLRAGFGLSGRPDDLFTGVGFSVRF